MYLLPVDNTTLYNLEFGYYNICGMALALTRREGDNSSMLILRVPLGYIPLLTGTLWLR